MILLFNNKMLLHFLPPISQDIGNLWEAGNMDLHKSQIKKCIMSLLKTLTIVVSNREVSTFSNHKHVLLWY